ncbi:uncharacterized protein DS421_6g194550 [Arachis hypogaea]|nr:uncharacterized protein DS421_6g194550 [Arachis hypogaea]
MARQIGNDGDINKLNEMTHYAGAADFEASPPTVRRVSHTLSPPDAIVPYLAEAGFGDIVPLKDFTFDNFLISILVERWRLETHTFHLPWGEVIPYGDVGVGGASPRCLASRGSTVGSVEEGVIHAEACVATGSCPPDATDRRSREPPTVHQIYQRFSQWCPSDRRVYQYPLAVRLVGLPQQNKDQHEARVLRWRVSLDRLQFDEFAWKVYDDPALQALCPS